MPSSKLLAENDTVGPDNRNARLLFTAPADGSYRLVAASRQPRGTGSYTLTVTGQNRIILSDILIGDVWVCSGQSNMAFPLSAADGGTAAAQANQPTLRLYDPNSAWAICNPTSAAQFSAVAYYFGQAIQQAKVINTQEWWKSVLLPWGKK